MQYDKSYAFKLKAPNIFDVIAITIVFGILALLVWAAQTMSSPYHLGEQISIILDVNHLIMYSMRTFLRMLVAMSLTVICTLGIGSLMAKNLRCRVILLPIIDILQSIPALSVFAFIIIFCVKLFPGSTLGLEIASIITTFFSQAWNMILSFYQSSVTIPSELEEVTRIYRLRGWQRFWRLEVPRAMPGLILNSMVSMSASWFAVVASEAIFFNGQNIVLPGIGSYIAQAIATQNTQAVGMAFAAMFFIILCYDQLLFRPLLSWSEKFKEEIEDDDVYHTSWFFDLLSRTQIFVAVGSYVYRFFNTLPNLSLPQFSKNSSLNALIPKIISWITEGLFYAFLIYISIKFGFYFSSFAANEVIYTLKLGAISSFKVLMVVLISSIIWIPIGVIIGSNKKFAKRSQPFIQFLAACPPQMLYPFVFAMIVNYGLNVDIWTAPLMVFGTQWYILFNVIAGSMMIHRDQRLVAANFGLKGWLLWRRLYLPAVMPYCVTGCITAAGGCWNVSMQTDTVVWGSQKIEAIGISSYINDAINTGDFDKMALGVAIMSFYVVLINQLLWKPLFDKVSAYR